MESTVWVGEPGVTHRTSRHESTGECSGRPKAFGQDQTVIALQKEGNATLVRTKQDSMLLPNACIKGEMKQKVLLIFNCIHVAMATDVLTCQAVGGFCPGA